jgi:hypothetical protein
MPPAKVSIPAPASGFERPCSRSVSTPHCGHRRPWQGNLRWGGYTNYTNYSSSVGDF